MSTNGTNPLGGLRRIERVAPSVPGLNDLAGEIHSALAALTLDASRLRGKTIAVSAGSRGIASLREIVRAVCAWLKAQGATPFVFPAMGSHGGATGEGQRKILEEYGVTPEFVGAEIRSAMETVVVGKAAKGYQSYMDRNAWESDGVIVINRIKPHTDFSGQIESGLLKMIAVGMGKEDGARETHRWAWRFGFEQVIRTMSGVALGSGKILCGLLLPQGGTIGLGGEWGFRAARAGELSAKVGYLFQNPDHQIYLPTVREELSLGLRRQRPDRREIETRVSEAACMFGLPDIDAPPALLSYGARRRLQAATYYLLPRDLLILDEIDSGLSYREVESLIDALASHVPGIILITHDLTLAQAACDRILVMEEGRITGDAPSAGFDPAGHGEAVMA